MRNFFIVALLLVFGLSSCEQNPAETLPDIKKKYEKINDNLNDLTLKQVDDITSAGGGNISGYYKGKEIKKINWQHFTDTNRTFTEYYFDDGMLIFALEQNFVYNRPVTYTEEKARANNDTIWYDDKKTKLENSRFYFKKNKLIKWVAPGNKEMPAKTVEFTNKESELWAKAALLIKQLKEQS
jgi:hypothetical protein